jgi:hypothetical protein
LIRTDPAPFVTGARVCYSAEALEPLRSERAKWTHGPERDRAHRWLVAKSVERGTVTSCERGINGYGWTVGVAWDGGKRSSTAGYLLSVAP